MTQEKAVRYGIKIAKGEEDAQKRVQYIYDASGLEPAKMDFKEGKFDYGGWAAAPFVQEENNYPCMVKYDGTEDYKLLASNYAYKEDGTTVSGVAKSDYAGNAMAAFKGGWLCQYETATDEYIIWSNVQYDNGYNAYHRTAQDGTIRKGFYRHIFMPASIGGKARSLSGRNIMGNNTAERERRLCKANGDAWEQSTWWQWNYIVALLKIMGKTDDVQETYGYGKCDSAKWETLPTGTLDDKGQFYGYSAHDKQIKVFHTEGLWGDKWERLLGLVSVDGVIKVQPHGKFNFTGEGYKAVYRFLKDGWDYGFVKDTVMTPYGRFPVSFEGSRHKWAADYGSMDTDIIAVPLVGGYCNHGLHCGACVTLNYAAGNASWYFAPGLSCEMPKTA